MGLQGLPPVAFQQRTNKAAPLFSYPRERPPAGSLDVQITVAPTLSLLYDQLSEQGDTPRLRIFRETVDLAAQATVCQAQQLAGYVGHNGRAWPSHLEITPVIHPAVSGIPGTRLHLHLFIGPTAIVVDDGHRYDIDRGALSDALDDIYVCFRSSIEETTTERFNDLGLDWGPPRPSAPSEILNPPLFRDLISTEYFLEPCTGLWGNEYEIWLAPSDEYRRDSRDRELRAAQRPGAGAVDLEQRRRKRFGWF